MSTNSNSNLDGPAGSGVREERLTARSVIASTLLGMETPRLPGRVLVAWARLFGIAEGTARVALSRMVTSGELVHADGRYELAGRLRDKMVGQTWSRHARASAKGAAWDGTWVFYVVDSGARGAAERAELRAAMRALRTGEVRESVWSRPANLPRDAFPDHVLATAAEQCLRIDGRPDTDPIALAARLFEVPAWQASAVRHIDRMASNVAELESGDLDALAPSFETAVHAIAHIRRDPLLPAALLPDDWPGAELRARYEEYETAFRRLWNSWYRDHARPV